jgi:hypothetical protein
MPCNKRSLPVRLRGAAVVCSCFDGWHRGAGAQRARVRAACAGYQPAPSWPLERGARKTSMALSGN